MDPLPLLALAALLPQDDADWRYRVPAAGEPGEHPIPTVLPVGTEPPEDLRLDVAFTGDLQRYGQLRYGDADSTRIAVVVDQRGLGDADLYVDANRDRLVTARDRLERGDDGRWVTSLAVETQVEGRVEHVPRRVVFRLGQRGGLLTFATMGFLEGRVELAGRAVDARRVDGDGDGFFTGERDQLWLDLDGSGELSPFGELFLYAPLLAIEGGRFALRSDRLGSRLALERIEGTGTIDVALPPVEGGAARAVRAMHVLLVGRDGSAVGVRAAGEPVEVPAGDYRLGMVTFSLADAAGGPEWNFVFSEAYVRPKAPWYAVAAGASLSVDPVGALRFDAGLESESCTAGDPLVARPALFTGDGLLINAAYRGLDAPVWSGGGLQARLVLADLDGATLDEATSGFA